MASITVSDDIRSLFLLRPEVAFLNHGSFGACPRQVFEEYGRWQLELEAQPVEFLGRRAPVLLREARKQVGEFVGADANDIVFTINATMAVNTVARSLNLGPGDEILTTDHEYGACDKTWNFITAKSGATYRRVRIPVPVTTHEDVVERIFAEVTPATKLLFFSHITSPTGLTFPAAEICRRARELGIMTLIDGAHVPGQVPLDLNSLGADFYTGNLHKWLCGPKGVAFLYARPEVQSLLEPLVISWGWGNEAYGDSQFIDYLQSLGTDDISAQLSIPAAIRFRQEHNWDEVVRNCHEMVRRARTEIASVFNAVPLCPDSDEWYTQMLAFLLPEGIDGMELKRRLYDEHLVEIPVFWWNDLQTIRISVQGYTTWEEVERLLKGGREVLASM